MTYIILSPTGLRPEGVVNNSLPVERRDTERKMAVEVFSVAVFLVVLRETLEAAIVVAVLLAFLKQTLDGSETTATAYKSMVRQVCSCSPMFSRLSQNSIKPLGLGKGYPRLLTMSCRRRCGNWHFLPLWQEPLGLVRILLSRSILPRCRPHNHCRRGRVSSDWENAAKVANENK